MSKFLRVLICLSLFAFAAADALAVLTVSIKAGPPTARETAAASPTAAATAPPEEYRITADPTRGSSVLELLDCANKHHPCAVFYPGNKAFQDDRADYLYGRIPAPPGSTLMLHDACGRLGLPPCLENNVSKAARIEKTDTEVDQVQIKGLEIISLDNTPKNVTISVDTGEDNFAPPSGTGSRSYPVTLFFGGSATTTPYDDANVSQTSCVFKNPLTTAGVATTACPGSHLTVTTGPTTPNTFMDIKMPCVDGTANPCIADDDYGADGSFAVTRTGEVTCVGQCGPRHEALVSTTFTQKNQTLMLLNSGVAAMARTEVENFGVEALYHAVADEFKNPFWVAFTAANEYYRAVPHLPEKASSSDHSLQVAFDLLKTTPMQFQGDLRLNSIGTPKKGGGGDASLPQLERFRNDRSYASYIVPHHKLRWKDVTSLQMFFQVTMGENITGDPRLDPDSGPLTSFQDCANGSTYVRVALSHEDDQYAGSLLIRLGSEDNFATKCANDDGSAIMSGAELIHEGSKRVDPFLVTGEKCCINVTDSQQSFGHLFVRSISLVVDSGSSNKDKDKSGSAGASFQVNMQGALINDDAGFGASLLVPDPNGYALTTDLPVSGRSIQISKDDGSVSKPVLTIPNKAIKNTGGQMVAQIPFDKLKSKTRYRVDLCLFGGRCIPGQGFFTLD
jgi:hypothetical protein